MKSSLLNIVLSLTVTVILGLTFSQIAVAPAYSSTLQVPVYFEGVAEGTYGYCGYFPCTSYEFTGKVSGTFTYGVGFPTDDFFHYWEWLFDPSYISIDYGPSSYSREFPEFGSSFLAIDRASTGPDSVDVGWSNAEDEEFRLFLRDDSGTIMSEVEPLTGASDWGKFLDETGDSAHGLYWVEDLYGTHSDDPHFFIRATFEITRLTPVPEPTTMLLVGTGLVGLAGLRRKFRK